MSIQNNLSPQQDVVLIRSGLLLIMCYMTKEITTSLVEEFLMMGKDIVFSALNTKTQKAREGFCYGFRIQHYRRLCKHFFHL